MSVRASVDNDFPDGHDKAVGDAKQSHFYYYSGISVNLNVSLI